MLNKQRQQSLCLNFLISANKQKETRIGYRCFVTYGTKDNIVQRCIILLGTVHGTTYMLDIVLGVELYPRYFTAVYV